MPKPPRNPTHPLGYESPTAWTDNSVVKCGSPFSESNTNRLIGQFPPLIPKPPNPIIKSKKSSDIQSFSTKIHLKSTRSYKIFAESSKISADLVRYHRIWWDLRHGDLTGSGKISTNPVRTWSNTMRSRRIQSVFAITLQTPVWTDPTTIQCIIQPNQTDCLVNRR